jgi:hypothetical protein
MVRALLRAIPLRTAHSHGLQFAKSFCALLAAGESAATREAGICMLAAASAVGAIDFLSSLRSL